MDKIQQWIEAMKEKGHSPIMVDGHLYLFAHEYETHNGPGCGICDWNCCWHCESIDTIPHCTAIEISDEKVAP